MTKVLRRAFAGPQVASPLECITVYATVIPPSTVNAWPTT